MFQGAAQLSLDAKGRFAVPTRHRESLSEQSGGKLVLTAHPHRCLLLYPEPAWLPIRDKILAAPSFDPRSAAAKRVLVGNARETELDAAGRLLIPSELREFAELTKEIWMVGMGTHFELWSESGWRRQHETAFEALAAESPPPGFEGLSL
ncbi:MAG: division/cell wall cluster transcriptional repressor MraZ [Rhodocyclaceae bacterium]|nr:division/cell wall cluster transcriptional repressor MraZ [Rhodocyclaceae bacterium]